MIQRNIGILTFPINNAGITPLSNLLDIICSISKQTCLLTGNEGYSHFKNDTRFTTDGFYYKSGKNVFIRLLKYILTQFRISYKLAMAPNSIDTWIFFIGGGTLIFPMITAKILNKKVILIVPGSIAQTFESKNNLLFYFSYAISRINYFLSNHIVLYSHAFIEQENLSSYQNKISVSPRHFIDFDTFIFKNNIYERLNIIGYIGRFSDEKGIMNFVTSLPALLEKRDNLSILLIGDGKSKGAIIDFLNTNRLTNRVNLLGWIEHENLPEYLDKLKLVVLPSYTEGLPNVMLEAMACGTPVLATPVGSIPDIIKDGNTGFLMENNSPECIAINVTRALKHLELENITKNARLLMEKEFTYKAAIERYKKVIERI